MVTVKSIRKFEITLDNGEKVEGVQIGKGRYSTAYRAGDTVYIKTSEKDNSKEMLSKLRADKHLPSIEFVGSFSTEHQLYRMPFYLPLTAANKVAFGQFKVLKAAWDKATSEAPRKHRDFHNSGDSTQAYYINEEFNSIIVDSELPETLKDAVQTLVYACQNYGGYQIEIAKRNCAVDSEGTLILLDPCFDREEISTARRAAANRATAYRY